MRTGLSGFAPRSQWSGPGAVAVVETRRENPGTGVVSTERRGLITSLRPRAGERPAAFAAVLAGVVRAHWQIENSLHWRLDVLLGEYACRARSGAAAANLAVLRKIRLKTVKVYPPLPCKKGQAISIRSPGMFSFHARTDSLGPYAMMHDLARLQYGRLLWKCAAGRARLLRHWTDERHPYRDRFLETWQPVVEEVLLADPAHDFELDASLKSRGLSLRVVVREVPPVTCSFFADSKMSAEMMPASVLSRRDQDDCLTPRRRRRRGRRAVW